MPGKGRQPRANKRSKLVHDDGDATESVHGATQLVVTATPSKQSKKGGSQTPHSQAETLSFLQTLENVEHDIIDARGLRDAQFVQDKEKSKLVAEHWNLNLLANSGNENAAAIAKSVAQAESNTTDVPGLKTYAAVRAWKLSIEKKYQKEIQLRGLGSTDMGSGQPPPPRRRQR